VSSKWTCLLSLLSFFVTLAACRKQAPQSEEKSLWSKEKKTATTDDACAVNETALFEEGIESPAETGCSLAMRERPVLKPLKNTPSLLSWRVDQCFPSAGVASLAFEEIRVTLNLVFSSQADAIFQIFSRKESGKIEGKLPEQVLEINLRGGPTDWAGLQRVFVIAAPTVTFDVPNGNLCGMRVSDVRLGITGVRVKEKTDLSQDRMRAVEGFFAGDHFVGNRVRAQISKTVDAQLKKIKPMLGCHVSGEPRPF
jgi:hypothetical protein